MIQLSQKEKESRNVGLLASLIIHLGLLMLLYFLYAYSPPEPPLPMIGTVLNFGTVDEGMGDNTTSKQEVQEEVKENEPQPPTESQPVTEQVVEEEVVSNDNSTSDIVAPPVVKEAPVKKPVEEKPVEETKPEKKPLLDKRAVFKPSGGAGDGDKNKAGNQGVQDGSTDSRSYYGSNSGANSGDNYGFDMNGWVIDYLPGLDKNKVVPGKAVFEITVDSNGDLVARNLSESTLPAHVVEYLKSILDDMHVKRASSNRNLSSGGKGKVVFKFEAR